MNWYALLDPLSAGIVLGGTIAATALRCGPRNVGLAAVQLMRIAGDGFRFDTARAQLAAQVEGIRLEGLLRAPENHSTDPEMLEITNTLIRTRSGPALVEKHRGYSKARNARRERAVDAYTTAGDLAPIFGLAGTLFALSQMPAETDGQGLAAGALIATVAMAVVTTLYGLLAAHVLFYPLGRLVERRGKREEDERQQLVDWLEAQVGPLLKPAAQDPAPTSTLALQLAQDRKPVPGRRTAL